MKVADEDLALAAEFPREQGTMAAPVEGVLAKSDKPGLSGAAAEQMLATEVEDCLRVHPLYTSEDAVPDPVGLVSRRSCAAVGRREQ